LDAAVAISSDDVIGSLQQRMSRNAKP
jgi:hypothetical protein